MNKERGIEMLRALLFGAVLFSAVSVEASEVFSAADLLEEKSWAVSVLGNWAESEPKLKIAGIDAIQVPVTGGSATIFSDSNVEIEMEQAISSIVALFEFRPREGFQYKFKAGQVREFEVEYSSGSQMNKFQATNDGYLWGVGFGGRIAPGSMVSTAIRWELGYTQTVISVDRFQGGSVVYTVDQQWRQEELQGILNFSRRWKSVEPYAGLKLIHLVSRLRDDATKGEIRGSKDGVSPFVGLQWMVGDRESLTLEGSFLDEKSLAAGFRVQF